MRYTALICDLDGTAIPNRHDGMPSKGVQHAITQAQKLVHVAAATARPYYYAEPVIRKLGLTGPSIFHNGARIIDVTDDTILWEQPLVTDAVFPAFHILKQADTRVLVNEDGHDLLLTEAYVPKVPLSMHIDNISPLLARDLLHQLGAIPTISAYTFKGRLPGTVGIVISHVSATKQHAIVKMAELLGVETHSFIGIGDSDTDFPLLMACGLKVAMNNAVEHLKAIADYVAPSVEEDGVADTIHRFILQTKNY